MSRVPFIGRAVERLLPGAVVQILAEQIAEGGAGAAQVDARYMVVVHVAVHVADHGAHAVQAGDGVVVRVAHVHLDVGVQATGDAQRVRLVADADSEELTVFCKTTRTHVRHIYEKLNIHSKQELIDLVLFGSGVM